MQDLPETKLNNLTRSIQLLDDERFCKIDRIVYRAVRTKLMQKVDRLILEVNLNPVELNDFD